jgi:serine/threonine protein kinase
MTDIAHCSRCGCELPAETPDELCPACLLQAGLEGDLSDSDAANGENSDPRLAVTTPQGGGFVPPDAEELAPLFPQLEVLGLLGHGGMGAVYQARQKKLDRLVALKIIRPEGAADPAFAERFMREARTLARLSHPGIVAIHDFGEVENAVPGDGRQYYFVMEYVDGANLRQLMEDCKLNAEQAFEIVPQICDALQFAHDEGVVHRDIKPENILVDTKGRVKIADFGLAKLATRSPEDFTLTATHQVMGTPRYMAPEQMAGSNSVDHRADIYSLGVVLYEMLTGEVPMGQFAPPSQKAAVDARLDDVVMRALASEPERRFQQASELKSDVDQISSGAWTPKPAQPAGRPYRTGVSTIMERELIDAWRWVAGENESSRQAARSYPTLFVLALMIAGCLTLLLPWCDVNVPGTNSGSEAVNEGMAEIVAGVCRQETVFRSASLLPVFVVKDRDVERKVQEPQVQQAALQLLSQESGSEPERPIRAATTFTETFRGLDLLSGIVVCIVFSLMTLMLLASPDRTRQSAGWNVFLLMLAATGFISALIAPAEVEKSRIRIPAGSVSLASNTPDSPAHAVQLCLWQDDSSNWPGRNLRREQTRLFVNEVEHTLRYRVGFVGAIGLSLALIVLSATGIRNAISRQQDASRTGAAQQRVIAKRLSRLQAEVRVDVSAPSLMMLIVGYLSAAGNGAFVLFGLSSPVDQEIAVVGIPGLFIGIAMVLGGMNLRSLSSSGWVRVGAVAGLLPLSAGWFLTALAGAWALYTLQKPHIREAFLQAEQQRPQQ